MLDVALLPSEVVSRARQDHDKAVCIVLDVFRATSSIVTALAHGASCVIPIEDPARARWLKGAFPDALLAGEEQGLKPWRFDLGNSPSEFACASVIGKTILMATTNGTRAILAYAGFLKLYVGSLLNLSATVDTTVTQLQSGLKDVRIVCAGTRKEFAWEDAIAAGAYAAAIMAKVPGLALSDSTKAVLSIYQSLDGKRSLAQILGAGRNGQQLRELGLGDDIDWCARIDQFPVVAMARFDVTFPSIVVPASEKWRIKHMHFSGRKREERAAKP